MMTVGSTGKVRKYLQVFIKGLVKNVRTLIGM